MSVVIDSAGPSPAPFLAKLTVPPNAPRFVKAQLDIKTRTAFLIGSHDGTNFFLLPETVTPFRNNNFSNQDIIIEIPERPIST